MEFQAVFFDMDDTLLDSTSALAEGWVRLRDARAAAQPKVDWDRLQPLFERFAFEEWMLGERPDRYDSPEDILTRAWERVLSESRQPNLGDPKALAIEFVEGMEKSWRLFDDVAPVLDGLRGHYRLAVVTNGGNDFQHRKYDRLGLKRWFDAVFVAEECLAAKPHPEHFHFACRHLGVDPALCLMVGDNPKRDVEGALGAGLSALWLNRTARYAAAPMDDRIGLITGLKDLPAWIGKVEAGVPPPKWWISPGAVQA